MVSTLDIFSVKMLHRNDARGGHAILCGQDTM